jgi:hypothetical protein
MTAEDDHRERVEDLIRSGDAYWLIHAREYGVCADDPMVAMRAVDAIRRIGNSAIPELVRALDEWAVGWRLAIRRDYGGSIGRGKRGADLDDMLIEKHIQHELATGTRNPCAPLLSALVAIGMPCVAPLIEYLDEGDWLGKLIAVEALGQVAGPDAIPVLKRQTRFLGLDRLSVAARSAIRCIEKRH